MRHWSWAGSPPEVDHEATVTLSMVDMLNPFSDGMEQLHAGSEAGVIRISTAFVRFGGAGLF